MDETQDGSGTLYRTVSFRLPSQEVFQSGFSSSVSGIPSTDQGSEGSKEIPEDSSMQEMFRTLVRSRFKKGNTTSGGFWGLKMKEFSRKRSFGTRLTLLKLVKLQSQNVPDVYNSQYEIRLSFYDVVYRQFVGETWKSRPIDPTEDGAQRAELNCNKILYFHSQLLDPNVVLVVEIVVIRTPKDPLSGDEVVATRRTLGWGVIRPFKTEIQVKDVSEQTESVVRRMDVYHGTPRALLFMGDHIETNENIQLVPGCQMSYYIQKHKELESVLHLMPENVLFQSSKCLPGIAEAAPKFGVAPDHYLKPKLLPRHTCYLDHLALNFGPLSVDKFEEMLCARVNQDRLLKDKAEDDGKTVSITERRLMVGVHNGYCYIQKPQFAQLEPEALMGTRLGSFGRGKRKDTSTITSGSPSTCLVLRSRVRLDEMVNDPGLAVVMQVEYQLALPYTSQAAVKGSATSLRSQPLSMSVRWTAWCPFEQMQSNDFITLSLQGGSQKNPDNILFYTTRSVTDQQTSDFGKLRMRFLTSDSPIASDSSLYGGISASDTEHLTPSVTSKPPIHTGSPAISRGIRARPADPALEYESLSRVPGNMYNVEITHLEMEGDLPPVHAPPILPVAQRTPSMSRAAYARMYSAGFPDIVDRHGNPAEFVDAREDLASVDITRDVVDPLQTNEIVIQFLAFSKPQPGPGESSPPEIGSLFCSFQFYRFQPVTTNRMSLTRQAGGMDEKGVKRVTSSLPFVLRKIEAGEHLDKGRPGLEIKYYIDPASMNAGESSAFLSYLRTHTLHIDIWDGDSLMLIGSLAVPLKHLLRQGRPAVAVNHEVDVIFSEHTDAVPTVTGEMSVGGSMRPLGMTKTYRGKLHMRLGNVGHVSENKSEMEASTLIGTKKHLVIADISGCGFVGGSVSTAKVYTGQPVQSRPKKCVAKKLTDLNKELCDLLLVNTNEEEHSINESPKIMDKSLEAGRKRKLARMLAIREAERTGGNKDDAARIGQRALVNKQERTLKIRDLKTVDSYRSRLKPNQITELLTLSITTQHTIRPSLGTAHFIEMQLKNPFSIQHTITIECDNPELRVITDSREWRFFKSICNLHTPVEENMFNFDAATTLPQIYLRPKETVFVPFRYQGFEVGQELSSGPSQFFKPTPTALQPIKGRQSHGTIRAKVVKAYLRADDGKPISVLQLNVEPQPHIVDQTFRFYNPENSFLKKCIRLPPFKTNLTGVEAATRFHVECSDPDIICQARSSGANEPQEIFMKAPCGVSPSVRRFYLALYNDAFVSAPVQIWQSYVHSMQRVDINSVLGQTTRLGLVLKGTQTARMVRCYSSHPMQMEVAPSESFLLSANNVTELTVGVRPIGAPGTRYMYVNVVDIEYHQLIRSWLVAVNSKQPIVSKEFEIDVPAASGKGCFKKITYSNPYPSRKHLQLLTSRPDLLSFKENQFELGPGETFTIGLRFAAGVRQSGKHNVHVFIDDDENKNEETFMITVNYI